MKKLINDPQDVVVESLEGLALAHPTVVDLHLHPTWVGRRNPKESGKVTIISGGGFGHEPLHTGYVGYGMLDAAVPGPVFTSPTPDPIMSAAEAVADKKAGILFIVKNYTGDVLNFETAADLLEMSDIRTEFAIVDDDIAVEDSLYTAGRRGVAGTILVEKIAGALAEAGQPLDVVAQKAKVVIDNTRTMGLALGPCTVPHAGISSFDLGEDEVEIGIGIHGEPGYRRGPMEDADSLTTELYMRVHDDLGLVEGDRVVAIVNGMGGTPESELYIVFRRVAMLLRDDNIVLERQMVGNFATSLEMPGVSLTLMRVDNELLSLYDAPAHTVAWRKH